MIVRVRYRLATRKFFSSMNFFKLIEPTAFIVTQKSKNHQYYLWTHFIFLFLSIEILTEVSINFTWMTINPSLIRLELSSNFQLLTIKFEFRRSGESFDASFLSTKPICLSSNFTIIAFLSILKQWVVIFLLYCLNHKLNNLRNNVLILW